MITPEERKRMLRNYEAGFGGVFYVGQLTQARDDITQAT